MGAGPPLQAPPGADYAGDDLEALSGLRRYRAWIFAAMRPHLNGHCVEIGAGTGAYSTLIRQVVADLDLVEPSLNLRPALEARFAADPRCHLAFATAETWAAGVAVASRDSVVLVNVLEHIRDDEALLAAIARALRPGGRLFLFVPAHMFLYSPLDARVGHFRRYGMVELRAKIARAGLVEVESRHFDFLGILPWLVVNRWMGRTDFSPAMAALYDAVAVPVGRWFEDRFRAPIGKNIALAARKP